MSSFRGIVPIHFLISIKLSLNWALEEVSMTKLMYLYNGMILWVYPHLQHKMVAIKKTWCDRTNWKTGSKSTGLNWLKSLYMNPAIFKSQICTTVMNWVFYKKKKNISQMLHLISFSQVSVLYCNTRLLFSKYVFSQYTVILIWFYPSVVPQMANKITITYETLSTSAALIPFLSSVFP